MRLPYRDPALLGVLLEDPAIRARLAFDQWTAQPPTLVVNSPLPPTWTPSPPRPALSLHDPLGRARDGRLLTQEWAPMALFIAPGGTVAHGQRVRLTVATQEVADCMEMSITVAEAVELPANPRYAPIASMALRDTQGAHLVVTRCWLPLPDGTVDTRYQWPDLDPRVPFLRQGERLSTADAPEYRAWRRLALTLHARAGGMPSWRARQAI